MDESSNMRPDMLREGKPSDFYVGRSMHPTLKPLDRLKLIDYGRRTVQPGDVVVFRSPASGRRVTHRVVKSTDGGIMTRGDNSALRDPWTLAQEKILGQVVSARRKGRWIPVHGGLRGRLWAAETRCIWYIDLMARRLGRTISRRLTGNHPFKLKLPVRNIFRTVSFQREEGTEFQLLIGSILLARQIGERGCWQLRRPYAWFLNEKSLPDPPSGSDQENVQPI
jgi:signal peptidase I